MGGYYLGLDVGSTYLKAALILEHRIMTKRTAGAWR